MLEEQAIRRQFKKGIRMASKRKPAKKRDPNQINAVGDDLDVEGKEAEIATTLAPDDGQGPAATDGVPAPGRPAATRQAPAAGEIATGRRHLIEQSGKGHPHG